MTDSSSAGRSEIKLGPEMAAMGRHDRDVPERSAAHGPVVPEFLSNRQRTTARTGLMSTVSAVGDVMRAVDLAMRCEDVDPGVRQRVLSRLLYGVPDGPRA